MKRAIFLALILSLGLNASQESKEQQESQEQVKSQCINQDPEVQQLMNGLEIFRWDDRHWPKRKEIIARLIQVHNINPNNISYDDNRNPLSDAARNNDLFFASFLLNYKANPNTTKGYLTPNVLFDVKSTLMAQLLFGHGVQLTENLREKILAHVIGAGYEPSLIPLYIQHGANVNVIVEYEGTPLIRAVQTCISSVAKRKFYVSELLKAHALISPLITKRPSKGFSAPSLLKEKLDEAREPDDIQSLQEIRAMMKQEYDHQYNSQREALEVHLIPDLAKMCVETYQELEKYPQRPPRKAW